VLGLSKHIPPFDDQRKCLGCRFKANGNLKL
jgi:hypothetical protein